MKKILALAALSAAVLVSCTQKELEVEAPIQQGESVKLIPITITASLEGTKADMVGTAWTWQAGDKLAVYDGTAKREFTLDESSVGTSIAKFSGEVAESFSSLKAVFPYAAAGDSFDTPLIPSEQTITDGYIDPAAMIAIADEAEKVSDDEFNFYFTSGVSMLRFTPPAGATKVILHTAVKDAVFAGDSPSVTVNLGSAADGSKQFWAAVNPAAYEGLHVFTLTADAEYYHLNTSATIDLSTPGKAKNLGNLTGKGNKVGVIETAAQLANPSALAGLDVFMVKDIDLTGVSLTPISSFSNTMDGLWHSISNWAATNGLFAKNDGTIQNLVIDKTCSINWTSAIPDQTGIAFIVAKAHTGTVKNCEVAGNITVSTNDAGRIFCAGIVGESTTGTVVGCKFSGTIKVTLSGTSKSCSAIAGIVARAGKATDTAGKVIIDDCENTGSISFLFSGPSGNMKLFGVGGILGQTVSVKNATNDYGTVRNCINKGAIEWEYTNGGSGSYPALGGVAGIIEGTIEGCSNYGTLQYKGSKTTAVTDASIGGVAGYVTLGATDCHNYGEIVIDSAFAGGTSMNQSGGNTSFSTFGGVFGNAGPYASDNTNCANKGIVVENCSNEASFTIKAYMVSSGGPQMCFGGLIGVSTANMKGCENKGNVVFESQAKTINAGGITGFLEADMENCTNSGNVTLNGASANHPPIDLGTGTTAGNSIHSQAYFGGIFGMATKGSVVKNVKNTGAITLENMYNCGDPANTTYNVLSYAGGINGSYKGGIIITDAENTGTITNKADVPVCLGGVSGAFNGTMTNGKNSGPVVNQSSWCSTVDGKQPEVGGVAGYANATFTNCENTGSLTNGPENGSMGGLVGSFGEDTTAHCEWAGCSVNCDITGNAIAGSVLGKFRYAPSNADAPTIINLGSSESPFTISGGVSSLPLCGSLKGNVVNEVNVIWENPTYRLYVLDEKVATSSSWGTSRSIWYSSEAGDIASAGTEVFGGRTYNYFNLTSDIVGNTADVYYKGENNCEVKITLNVQSSKTNYYYQTDGILVGAVADPASPEALSTTPRIYVRSNVDGLNCHMWGGDSETVWPGTAMTVTTSREYEHFWRYVDLIPNSTGFIINSSGWQTGDLNVADFVAADGSCYLYCYGADNVAKITW